MDTPTLRIGITGQSGFIGTHLSRLLGRYPEEFSLIPFEDAFWEGAFLLSDFVYQCDVIIHLAFVNRHSDADFLYQHNVKLARELTSALEKKREKTILIYASSIREGEPTAYGKAKKECRHILEKWAERNGGIVRTCRIPNVFGPGARPYYNSFIATFCDQLLRGEGCTVTEKREVPLLYVESLCEKLLLYLRECHTWNPEIAVQEIEPDFRMEVEAVLAVLRSFVNEWRAHRRITTPRDPNLIRLRTTFLSHTNPDATFQNINHQDPLEIIHRI